MKKHSGMRPHDIVVLIKIAAKGDKQWMMKDLSYELGISASEVSESLNRSVIARLITPDKKRLMKLAMLDFLEHGLCYVYPQSPGALVRGIKTAHSAPPLSEIIVSNEHYVWPYSDGDTRGQAIEPLHPKIPEACLKDSNFYALMALCDVLRVGRVREKNLALEELKKEDMLKNTQINRIATQKIALALGELNEKVVYVGGAVVSLYIDDTTAEDVRPTKDIDITLEIFTLGELEKLRQLLNQKGFYQTAEDNVVCRFRFEEIKIDVMATRPIGWAPANPWFDAGIGSTIAIDIDYVTIKILSLPYYLATKFAAFYDRGQIDPRTSHDFEDIVYLLNYTSYLKPAVLNADGEVRTYLKQAFSEILDSSILQEAVIGNLYYENQMTRFNKILNLLKEIRNGL